MFDRARFGGKRRKGEGEVEVNLIPVMNLFTAIIPFLLLGVSFYQVAGISSSVPTAARDGASDVADTPRAVTLTLGVSLERGYTLGANGTGVDPSALAALAAQVPRRDGDFDTEALARLLLKVKQDYPDSDTVIVVPEGEVLFEDLVRTMDAAREVVVAGEGGAVEAPHLELFPRVVLSRTL